MSGNNCRLRRIGARVWPALAVFAAVSVSRARGEAPFIGFVDGNVIRVHHGGEALLELSPLYWGPGWSWVGLRAASRREGEETVIESAGKSGETDIRFVARVVPRERSLAIDYTLRAAGDVACTLGVVAMTPGAAVLRTEVVRKDGTKRLIEGGYGRAGLGREVAIVKLLGAAGELARLRFDPPAEIVADGAARIVLAAGELAGDRPRGLRLTVELPGELVFHSSPADVPFEPGFEQWYVWQPRYAYDKPSVSAMDDWLDKPAGRRGRVRRVGDELLCGDRPLRLWGLNLCYAACAPEKELAEKRARFYARHGVNAVRLHKYADGHGWAGIQSPDSFVTLDPAGLDRMDHFIARLKERGIHIKLSAHFGTPKLGAGDKAMVPYLEEFGRLENRPGARVEVPAGAVYYSRELQDVQIAHYVNLLRHRNPHTGLTYAAEPAIAFIEILNEQSVLFFTSMGPLKASATLRKAVGARFCDWLRKKYGDHAGLVAAWGERALDSFGNEGFAGESEHLDRGTILPLGNPWFWDPDQLEGSQAFRRRRLLDTLVFLTGLQDEFHARFTAAVRQAGYEGEIVASNWQAGRAFSHFLNLHSDALVGTVDRHNYYGGPGETMLRRPGSGLLGSGLQQVAGRPFMLSEWIHTWPNEFGAEGPAIIGAYGLGLQGWDASFMFQNSDNGEFSEVLGRQPWDVTAPQIFGLFPAVARQVLRGDVRTAGVVAPRFVHVPSLGEGRLGFDDRVRQAGDVKDFAGETVPPETLAVARCVVEFTDSFRETPPFDLAPHVEGTVFRAVTGQLRWTAGNGRQSGFFTIDTEATQAVVGFAKGQAARLSQALITSFTPFAAIYITASRPGERLADARSLLVTAIARARNSGAKVVGDTVLDKGAAPILMEPVRAEIRLSRPGTPVVRALDHDGCRTETRLPVTDGCFVIDGARDKTPYYEIEYAP
jgi:hypothetical protein